MRDRRGIVTRIARNLPTALALVALPTVARTMPETPTVPRPGRGDKTAVDGYLTASYKLNRRPSFIGDPRRQQRDANLSRLGYQSARIGSRPRGDVLKS
jgi:hypothetical protein